MKGNHYATAKRKNIFKDDFLGLQQNVLHPPAFFSIKESYASPGCNSVHLQGLRNSSHYIISGNLPGQVNKVLPSLLWY